MANVFVCSRLYKFVAVFVNDLQNWENLWSHVSVMWKSVSDLRSVTGKRISGEVHESYKLYFPCQRRLNLFWNYHHEEVRQK